MAINTNTTTLTIDSKLDRSYLVSLTTTSGKIRYLNSIGYNRSEISKILNIRYQHVRNILITPVKKGS